MYKFYWEILFETPGQLEAEDNKLHCYYTWSLPVVHLVLSCIALPRHSSLGRPNRQLSRTPGHLPPDYMVSVTVSMLDFAQLGMGALKVFSTVFMQCTPSSNKGFSPRTLSSLGHCPGHTC